MGFSLAWGGEGGPVRKGTPPFLRSPKVVGAVGSLSGAAPAQHQRCLAGKDLHRSAGTERARGSGKTPKGLEGFAAWPVFAQMRIWVPQPTNVGNKQVTGSEHQPVWVGGLSHLSGRRVRTHQLGEVRREGVEDPGRMFCKSPVAKRSIWLIDADRCCTALNVAWLSWSRQFLGLNIAPRLSGDSIVLARVAGLQLLQRLTPKKHPKKCERPSPPLSHECRRKFFEAMGRSGPFCKEAACAKPTSDSRSKCKGFHRFPPVSSASKPGFAA